MRARSEKAMTKTIKQAGEAFNPHGVQFWADDENAVRKVLRFAEEVGAELDTHGTSHTIRLRIGGGATPAFTGMSFGAALEAMKNGKAVRLPHWSPEVCIRMQVPDEGSKMTHAYLYAQSRFGCVPWIPTQVELLSCEWEVADARLREKGEPLSATPRRLASETPARREVAR